MLVGGHSLLVNSGQPYPYTRDKSTLDGLRARTAAGISEDRSTLYLVGVEGRTSESVGLTLDDLTLFLVDIGVWQAVNLDGGGSTTLVTRPLGEKEVQRAFPTEQQWERMVVNAIGIYSTAPQGQLKDIVIKGKDKLVVGDTVDYTLRAYDEYYNPFDLSELDVEWSITNNLGTLTNNSFSATSPGKTTLTVKINGLTKELPLTIISKEEAQKEEMAKLIAKIGQGTITGSVVNVRSGPDLTFDVLTQVNLGTQLKILDQEGEWLQVQLTEENLGWVANWLMDYPQVPGLVTGKVVNVRKGPGTDQEVLTQVKKDDQITLLTKNKEWYKVALSDGSTGWIIDWLVKPILDK
jgi:SH3-like domain-containing protein